MSDTTEQVLPTPQITATVYKLKSVGHQGSILLNVFNGQLTLSISKEGNSFKDAFRRTLFDYHRMILIRAIKKLLKSGPDVKLSYVFMKTDDSGENRKPVRDFILTVGRDEKRVFFFEFDIEGHTFGFEFFGMNMFVGSEQMTEADISELGAEAMLEWLTSMVPVERSLTNRTARPKEGGSNYSGGGNRGGGGGNRGGGYSRGGGNSGGHGGGRDFNRDRGYRNPQAPPQPSAPSSEEDTDVDEF